MNVEIISATPNPIEVISRAAGTCYGKDNMSQKRVENCFNSGHLSVFEHATVTLRVEGISRACMAQLTRHRLVSFCVESQRYNKYDLSDDDWYVMPDSFDDRPFDSFCFKDVMQCCAENYMSAVREGMKPEDARYLLPEATKTNLVMTCNLREIYHIFDMRRAQSAQWEIRGLANAIADALKYHNRDWRFLVGLWSA